MSKISLWPPTSVLLTSHIVPVVDTAKPDATANEQISAFDFGSAIQRAAYLFGSAPGGDTEVIGAVETTIIDWEIGAITGNSDITVDPVAGTLNVVDAGIYQLEASAILTGIGIGNENDVIMDVAINGTLFKAISTSYYTGTSGGSSQIAISLNANTFLDLAALDSVSLMLTTTGAGTVTYDSRHVSLNRIA